MRLIGLAVVFVLSLMLASLDAEGQPKIGILGSPPPGDATYRAFSKACTTSAMPKGRVSSSSSGGGTLVSFRSWPANSFASRLTLSRLSARRRRWQPSKQLAPSLSSWR